MHPVRFKVGEYVVIQNVSLPGQSQKLIPKFMGPYIVGKCYPIFDI